MRLDTAIDACGLPIFGVEIIAGRRLQYSWPIGQDRLRVVFLDRSPSIFGSVIRLDTIRPCLAVSEPLHLEWGNANAEGIIAEALRLWQGNVRRCDG